jgi:hypothetical protein
MATDIQRLIEQIDALPPDDQARVRQAILATAAAPSPPDHSVELQQRLIAAGLLKGFKAPRRDTEAFQTRKPANIQGKPLSETIIEERR